MIKLCHDPDRPSPIPRVSEISCGCDGQSYGHGFLPRLSSYAESCAQETDIFTEAAEATPERQRPVLTSRCFLQFAGRGRAAARRVLPAPEGWSGLTSLV
jgi:hypothetical protein